MPRTLAGCGTQASYGRGCRCAACTTANADSKRAWRRRSPVMAAKENARSFALKRLKSQWVWQYKAAQGCADCPERDPVCLELHHRDPSVKEGDVSAMYSHSWEAIRAEVAKCDVVCANCHRKRHRRDSEGVLSIGELTAL